MENNFWIYLLVMFAVTYAIRVIPLALIRKKITNRFVRSFLEYIPYTVLGSMTFPSVFYAVQNPAAGAVGAITAIILSITGRGLCTVAACASAAVFIAGKLL